MDDAALVWRTPNEMFGRVLRTATTPDGASAADTITALEERIAYEVKIFNELGAQPQHRDEHERIVAPYREAIEIIHDQVRRLMVRLLEDGTLLAIGRHSPDQPRSVIPARYWSFMEIDFDARSASGQNLAFHTLAIVWRAAVPAGHRLLADLSQHDQFASGTPVAGRSQPEHRPASSRDLAKFLAARVATLSVGHPELSETALWNAAKSHFKDKVVPRSSVRQWIASDMDPAKRLSRGAKTLRRLHA